MFGIINSIIFNNAIKRILLSNERNLVEERRSYLLKQRAKLLESSPKIVYEYMRLKTKLKVIEDELGMTKENNLAKFLKDEATD